jgi:hypothetical protein
MLRARPRIATVHDEHDSLEVISSNISDNILEAQHRGLSPNVTVFEEKVEASLVSDCVAKVIK